ncbi:hypothetical protein GCM10008171_02620 [Methylopila jiangsuensis]|uniref:Membrane protein involved in the export of O-antigen and teichoic acid n=1 Tax=Methylopila jiangsuensis TaxID=586230 RepID=A0A9W6JGA4_9HYPH|nr:hypothetical protein GCM10008171_02620 [Methylopila jiangsuensis]
MIGWIGWAGADAIGRILLLTLSTAVLSRLLEPRDFGVTALALTVVAVLSVFVGAPFEEALAQRKRLRRSHLEAALAASWLAGLALLLLTIPGGMALGAFYDAPELGLLLPVASLAMFFSGHTDIATALARRRRRFNDVAYASLMGHVIGVSLSLALAVAGAGVWALIGVRLFVMIARAVLLQARLGALIRPRWSTARLKELSRFAGFSFLERLADNLTYLAFNTVVGAAYGVTTLGYVNMAMRLIEPIRGAIVATAHNLSFSFFARPGATPGLVAGRTAYLIAPVFVGLAAVTPALLPLVAGPGWESAGEIAVCLALGGALAVPARLVFTALSAAGRPEFGLASSLLGFAATLAVLVLAIPLGPPAVGFARLIGDGAQAAMALLLPAAVLGWPPRRRVVALAPAWALSAAMGLAAAALVAALRPYGDLAAVLGAAAAGAALYVALLAVFARHTLRAMALELRPRRGRPAETTS